ncbi:MAG: DUF72 domain-containing protein [Chloroflexota bacterium]
MTAGRLLVGTSGFAYPGWSPRFYPTGLRADGLLAHYGRHFPAVELNNTFYQRPAEAKVRAWLAATPPDFRFAVKAQRGASLRAILRDPGDSVPWLTESLIPFGPRLGAVLFRVPAEVTRDDSRLALLLGRWPTNIPLCLEFQDPSWHVDETFHALESAGAVLCATELPEADEPPVVRRTGPFLYLRLRRHDYSPEELAAWASRLEPFLVDGMDAFVFFRHDDVGRATDFADRLRTSVGQSVAGV